VIEHYHHITKISHNGKTGPISVTRTDTRSCPPSCPLLGNGCYDQQGNGNIHRSKVDSKKYKTLSVVEVFNQIENLSPIYRHNEGGDLWSGETPEHINADILKEFAAVNRKARRKAIVYTHKPVVGSRATAEIREHNFSAIVNASADFAINVSVETLADVDQALALGLDCVVVLPAGTGAGVTKTPAGNKIDTCPATYNHKIQCSNCGKGRPLCLRKNRGRATGFPAHGSSKKSITDRIVNQ